MVTLMPHQEEAAGRLDNGKILWGGVGSGKSLTVLQYYVDNEWGKDIYVITTAKKRDTLDWEGDAVKFGLSVSHELTQGGAVLVESWNNLKKFEHVENAFFIFDEQRVVGTGAWTKSFIKIARKNHWVLLSATPGDTWLDYAPVFVANGWYRNITEFKMKHVVYEAFAKYPKVKGYINESRLEELRNDVLVEMPFLKHTTKVLNWLEMDFDKELMNTVMKRRWNVYEDAPCKDIAELFRVMRKVANSDPSRLEMVRKLMGCHNRLVIFYNFNYELEALRSLSDEIPVYEWNGHKKDPLPETDRWVYLVQYSAGAEGWNCTSTNAMIMYSLTYSFKNFEQAQGRIDRLDTPYKTLYYYIFASNSSVDLGVRFTLDKKQSFNEKKYWSELSKKWAKK